MGESAASAAWMIRSGISIIAMQVGFALLESGAVRNSNTAHVMVKNLSDLTLGVLMYVKYLPQTASVDF